VLQTLYVIGQGLVGELDDLIVGVYSCEFEQFVLEGCDCVLQTDVYLVLVLAQQHTHLAHCGFHQCGLWDWLVC